MEQIKNIAMEKVGLTGNRGTGKEEGVVQPPPPQKRKNKMHRFQQYTLWRKTTF
jgi:hypothetical protein